MLGYTQAGMKSGFTLDPNSHWPLLPSARGLGRSFIPGFDPRFYQSASEDIPKDDPITLDSPVNSTILQLLAQGRTAHYNNASASSKQGLHLRLMMALFGEWENGESNIAEAIHTLQDLDATMNEQSDDDKLIHEKIVEFCRERSDLQTTQSYLPETSVVSEEQPMMSSNPRMAALTNQVSGFLLIARYFSFR